MNNTNTTNKFNKNTEIDEFFNFLNSQNNMNLKKIILFYSNFSKVCDQFVNSLHPYYRDIISFICVDNSLVRKRLSLSKYKLEVVPSIFMIFDNGTINVHTGKELIPLVDFFNKNIETFMVLKTKKNQSVANLQNSQIEYLNQNQSGSKKQSVNSSQGSNVTELNIPKMSELKKNKNVTHLPRIKEPISHEFNKKVDIGMSSKRIVPKGKKEHEKMALTSVKFIEGTKLDTIKEDDCDDDDDDDDDDANEDSIIQVEDAETLDDDINDIINDDPTIDPILKKDNKKSLKEIAADMLQMRENIDEKNKQL